MARLLCPHFFVFENVSDFQTFSADIHSINGHAMYAKSQGSKGVSYKLFLKSPDRGKEEIS